MLFLVNPGGRKDRKVTKKRPRRVTRRRKRPAKGATHSEGIMARRRRSRAKARASAPRRRSVRRRRRSVARARVRSNPPVRRRRRRRPVVAHSSRRVSRRFRRNPGIAPSGIVRTLKEGVVDGVTVLAGEIVQNKVVAIADRFVPTMTGVAGIARTAGLNLIVATVGSLAARKFAPGRSRMLAAGLFARATANILATTPAAALLGDGAVYEVTDGVSAYPGLSAYPGSFAAYPSVATADVPHAEH
jgi:hypothetical protein